MAKNSHSSVSIDKSIDRVLRGESGQKEGRKNTAAGQVAAGHLGLPNTEDLNSPLRSIVPFFKQK